MGRKESLCLPEQKNCNYQEAGVFYPLMKTKQLLPVLFSITALSLPLTAGAQSVTNSNVPSTPGGPASVDKANAGGGQHKGGPNGLGPSGHGPQHGPKQGQAGGGQGGKKPQGGGGSQGARGVQGGGPQGGGGSHGSGGARPVASPTATPTS